MCGNVVLNYFLNKLNCFKSLNNFLDEFFFNNGANHTNNEKKKLKFVIFYKK